MNQDNSEYEHGIQLLIDAVTRINGAESSDENGQATERKKISRVVDQLNKTLKILEDHETELFIEDFHDERGQPPVEIGLDGLPVEPPPTYWPSYKSVYWGFRELSESFRLALDDLPDARQKRALSHAAVGFLHLRHDCGLPWPKLYDGGDDVTEFKEICRKAGIYRADETYRNALSKALNKFDPHYYGDEFSYFFQ